jgi:hypothetical protein
LDFLKKWRLAPKLSIVLFNMSIMLMSGLLMGLSNIAYGLGDENKSTIGAEIPLPFPLIKDMPAAKLPSTLPFTSDMSSRGTITSAPSISDSCQKLAISSIKASGYESSPISNPPTNTIDNNLGTRWSNYGVGSWIQGDIGTKIICSVDIAWYNGNQRQNNFVISVSNDGITFTNVFTGKSSGTTLSPERYNLPANISARYVRITVNGNTQNNWASITEIAVYGYVAPPPPPPPSGSNLDKFGIKQLYTTKSGGEEWYMNMLDPKNDARLFSEGGVALTKNPNDASYKVKSSQVRLYVYTSSGYHPDRITTYDQKQLASKGYMQSPNDWKNVEITGYFKVNHYTSSTANGVAHITLHARGGTHDSRVSCEGTAYHSNTYQTGESEFLKELEHTQGYARGNPDKVGATSKLDGRWVGLKAVYYTKPDNTVKLEQWIDDGSDNINAPGNNWHKLLEFTDIGSWGGGTPNCGGTPSTIITWGGPIVDFRWDNIDDMDFKNASVREIQPPSS